eukprot:3104913-Pyramimonas_sp.AAC.2
MFPSVHAATRIRIHDKRSNKLATQINAPGCRRSGGLCDEGRTMAPTRVQLVATHPPFSSSATAGRGPLRPITTARHRATGRRSSLSMPAFRNPTSAATQLEHAKW